MSTTDTFQLYYNGNELKILTDLLSEQGNQLQKIHHIIRICYTDKYLLLLSDNYNLYYCDHPPSEHIREIQLKLWKTNIIDIDSHNNVLYLVSSNGIVMKTGLDDINDINDTNLTKIVFYNEDIKILRIKCNAIGCIYLTTMYELYGEGKFDDILMKEDQNEDLTGPLKLELSFYPQQRIIDISCGENFFMILTELETYNNHQSINNNDTDDNCCNLSLKIKNEKIQNNNLYKEIFCNDYTKNIKKHSSKDSLVSTHSSSSTTDTELRIKEILKQGYHLIHTTVYSFGTKNEGVLGTGDHIKRKKFNEVLNLDHIGCYNISCGTEHSIARTIDGRLFIWGLNNCQQINPDENIKDVTSPKELVIQDFENNFATELNFENIEKKLSSVSTSSSTVKVLDSHCSDNQTVLLSTDLQIYKNNVKTKRIDPLTQEDKNISLSICKYIQLHSIAERNKSIIISANNYILINKYNFTKSYFEYFNSLQSTIQKLLKNLQFVKYLKCTNSNTTTTTTKSKTHKTTSDEKFKIILNNYGEYLKFILPICLGYFKILYALTTCLNNVEKFYRNDINVMDLLVLKNSKEFVQIFQEYTKLYCDIKSINGFTSINKILELNIIGNISRNSKLDDYDKVFNLPFIQISNIIKLIETLCKDIKYKNSSDIINYLQIILLEWQELLRTNRIEIELAEHTQEFWLRNSRNTQIRSFKKPMRRVILDSSNVPLKLLTSSAFSTNAFILFSDCLCQYGSNLQTFPLISMWILLEGDFGIRVFTPEKGFVLSAQNYEHKMLWFDQLKSAILTSLNKPIDSTLSETRTTAFVFSEKHSMYPNVRAYGRWRLGLMHGCCYLEYPDGKIYFGDVKKNQIDGDGKMILPQIGIYEGSFHNGHFNGYGYYEMKDNETYEGNFRDGLFHGHGILRTNKYTYFGEFINNMKNGYGIFDDLQSGEKYLGMFAENKRIGAGTCITMNGDYFEGFFVNDEISGDGLAVFENGYYYIGNMTMKGPNGKGSYYIPIKEFINDNCNKDNDQDTKPQMIGNILSGNLTGNWTEVRIVSGTVSLNKTFDKFPNSIGNLVVINNKRKWRSLFENWEEQIFGNIKSQYTTAELWNKIANFMTKQKNKNNIISTKDSTNYFAKNITNDYNNFQLLTHNNYDKISMKSTTSLFTNIDDHPDGIDLWKSYSNEDLFERYNKCDKDYEKIFIDNSDLNCFINFQQQFNNSTRTSVESANSISSFDNSNLTQLDYVPNFGINSLNHEDFERIKDYLNQAFKHPYHPFSLLNQKISTCFYNSYGCWKVKPTASLAYQAIKEWESISQRVYHIVRKLFPALPETFCEIEGYREIISHISLLYPIVLSEGIYSTLFVLYANKFSEKDELYRQRIMTIEKKSDEDLAEFLKIDRVLLDIITNVQFQEAIQTFKQVTEEYSPKGMLDVIEKSMQLIDKAHSNTAESTVILAADNMIPLTLFLIMRANVPHLGAELALLDDLTGEENFELNMSGLPGYCYTTIKAAYEHIVNGNLFIS